MIGIFDSGSGGLSVASEIVKTLPQCDVVYIGDIQNMPYGNKSPHELSLLTQKLISFLVSHDCTTLVSACNSISSQVILNKHFHHEIPTIEMVRPTVSYLSKHPNKKIALVATPATVTSNMYQTEFLAQGHHIHMIANPHLATAIETHDETIMQREIISILTKCTQNNIDILSLSCTHYPLIKNTFETIAQELHIKITIYDPSSAVAEEIARTVKNSGTKTFRAYTTKHNPQFIHLLKQKIPHATHEVISL